MNQLHPVMQQALKPFAPPTQEQCVKMDAALERIKALPFEQTPAYQRAMERQIQAQHVRGGVL
jgi:hypothetical protein